MQNALTYGSGRLGVGIASAGTLMIMDSLLALLYIRFPALEHRISGEPTVICTDGRLDRRAMRREGVEDDELQAAMRAQGVGDLSQVRLAVLEMDGEISIIPKR